MESKPLNLLIFDEVAEHNQKQDCWLIISGKVYDLTTFLEEHPGGDDILLNATGKDATDEFDEVGHSDDAKEMMKKLYVGEIDVSTIPNKKQKVNSTTAGQGSSVGSTLRVLQLLIPVIVFALAFYWNYSRKEED